MPARIDPEAGSRGAAGRAPSRRRPGRLIRGRWRVRLPRAGTPLYPLCQFPADDLGCRQQNLPESVCLESRLCTCLLQDARQRGLQPSVNVVNILNRGCFFLRTRAFPISRKTPSGVPFVNVYVSACKVAQRFQGPPIHGFQYEPDVPIRLKAVPCDGETELKCHVQPGRGRVDRIDLNAGQVMK